MFGQRVQHVVEEADPRPDPDVLTSLQLRRMVPSPQGGYAGLGFEDRTFRL